ncbi:hypothetical protein [Paenibacillus aceris]|uniref:Uncharacterized protein n=1 Tax=Paenibacillus aceris TaxID=869555 RepID=A0ABS4I426_9BACL|nr:hypothetical protein [Paenibacillus aceris]MBP1965677.1 hypothetical protein [Paenibacillus aceris]NHW36390.1 hypothetical protein [Paenibacillus aceris]
MTKNKLTNIGRIVGYSILGFVLLIVILCLIYYKGLLDLEKKERGFVELPNNYYVFQASQEGPYDIAAWKNDDKQVVKPNILEIAWDERYVLFKRVDGTEEEIGVLDTKTKKVKSLSYSSDNLQKLKSEFSIAQDITLKSVTSLWPDRTKRR